MITWAWPPVSLPTGRHWRAVVQAVEIPVVVNGDCGSVDDARAMLKSSALAGRRDRVGEPLRAPPRALLLRDAQDHLESLLSHMVRKAFAMRMRRRRALGDARSSQPTTFAMLTCCWHDASRTDNSRRRHEPPRTSRRAPDGGARPDRIRLLNALPQAVLAIDGERREIAERGQHRGGAFLRVRPRCCCARASTICCRSARRFRTRRRRARDQRLPARRCSTPRTSGTGLVDAYVAPLPMSEGVVTASAARALDCKNGQAAHPMPAPAGP